MRWPCVAFLLYRYFLAVIKRQEKIRIATVIPIFISLVWYCGVFLLNINGLFKPFADTEELLRRILSFIFLNFYLLLIWNVYKTYAQKVQHFFSDSNSPQLRLLRTMVIGLLLLWIPIAAEVLIPSQIAILNSLRIIIFMVILVALSLVSTMTSDAFNEIRKEIIENHARNSTQDIQRLEKHKDRLIALFKDNKPYLDPHLRLSSIAELLNLKPYEVSRVLRFGLNTNFFDFVNGYRIEEAKKRLQDPTYKNLSILGIAFDCGFNSKSSFSEAFKKWTKTTPSQFRATSGD